MDAKVMEFRMKQWIPIFEKQAQSGLSKEEWCDTNGINRHAFFKWQREIRSHLLANNLKMPTIANEYFQMEPAFVDVTKEVAAPAVVRKESEPIPCLVKPVKTSELSIRYGRFSIDINEGTDEKLLSMALGVIKSVN